jgi:hypothetical protein
LVVNKDSSFLSVLVIIFTTLPDPSWSSKIYKNPFSPLFPRVNKTIGTGKSSTYLRVNKNRAEFMA